MGTTSSTPINPACFLEEPFRKHKDVHRWSDEEVYVLKGQILDIKPYRQCDFDTYNLLLVGPCGAGKSSLKNTIKSAFNGEISVQADSGQEQASLTRNYTIGPIRGTDGKDLGKFRFVDMPGLDDGKILPRPMDENTIAAILDGKLQNRFEFQEDVPISPDLTPNEKRKIHCVIMVLDGTKTSLMDYSHHVFKSLRTIRKLARARDVPVAVVVTHLDEICSCVKEDISKLFNCKSVKDVIESIVAPLGIDCNRIFLVQNYARNHDINIDKNVDCLTLLTLKYLLQYCREYADSWLDAREDYD